MPNLHAYVLELGNQTFEDCPFCAPDALALTQLVYMPMEGLFTRAPSATVAQLWAFLHSTYPNGFTDPFQRKRFDFTETCAESIRFFSLPILDYINHIDPKQETQFCACTFALPDGSYFVAFRGTDLTIAGWKEDLNMSFMSVPAQREAVRYVQHAAKSYAGPLLLGGHSKGGHLAAYAAAHVGAKTQSRIVCVYSFDGPGMDEATLQSEGYIRARDRIMSYIPQSSVVGMLLCYHPEYQVVRSTSVGLLQHDALTWQIRDGAFETLEGLDLGTRLTDEALRQWIDGLSLAERRMLTDTVFRLISSLDSETVDPLVRDFPASSIRLFAAFRRLEPETRAEMRRLLNGLFASGANEAARVLLPAALRRFVDAPDRLSSRERIGEPQGNGQANGAGESGAI
jgi:hypothetical protein